MFPCYSLLNIQVIWWNMVSTSPPITMGSLNLKICQNFAVANFLIPLWEDELLWVELKIYGGVIFITILLYFHYFISLKTANTQKSEVFLLRISSGNVNPSVVTCRYPQIYNFSFTEEFLKSLCKCIYLEF